MLRNTLILIIVGIQMYVVTSKYVSPAPVSPPHCTRETKVTDYSSRYRLDYPVVYIHPGKPEAYQQLYCVKPPAVNTAVVVACDWTAPPQIQFALGDDYARVVRVDPSGRFDGNAVITTYQLCNHNMTKVLASSHPGVTSTLV